MKKKKKKKKNLFVFSKKKKKRNPSDSTLRTSWLRPIRNRRLGK